MGTWIGRMIPLLTSNKPICEADNNKIECCVTEVSSSSSESDKPHNPNENSEIRTVLIEQKKT